MLAATTRFTSRPPHPVAEDEPPTQALRHKSVPVCKIAAGSSVNKSLRIFETLLVLATVFVQIQVPGIRVMNAVPQAAAHPPIELMAVPSVNF
jgi:hypothetical protein